MNGNLLVIMLLVILGGAASATFVKTQRDEHAKEIGFMSDHLKTYANYVSTAARNNPALTGTLSRAQANVPTWLTLEPTVSNYVQSGSAYVYFTPKTLAEGNEVARKCGGSLTCGVKDTSGRVVQPGTGDSSLAAPAAIPAGSFVMVLGAGDPNCVVPDRNSVLEYDPQTQPGNCPAGQAGSQTLTRTRERTAVASCPDTNGALQWAYSGWSAPAWNVASSTCVNCPAPSTQYEYQWVGSSASCSAGQYGVRTWQRQQVRSRSVTYNCPAGTAAVPAPTYGAWSGWSDTGATQNNASSCTSCPGAWTEYNYQWVGASQACPAGYTGSFTWQKQQAQSRTVSYNCAAAPSSLPPPSYSGWSGWWDTGARQAESNTCAPPAGSPYCPSGQQLRGQQMVNKYTGWDHLGSWGAGQWTALTPAQKSEAARLFDSAMVLVSSYGLDPWGNPYQGQDYFWLRTGEGRNYNTMCASSGDIGKLYVEQQLDYDCVEGMGMHSCDYESTSYYEGISVCEAVCSW